MEFLEPVWLCSGWHCKLFSAAFKPCLLAGLWHDRLCLFSLLFIVVRRLLFGDPVAGWASTMSVILFIGGLQLFCLGLMGQYIAKIYLETKQRPHYIVGETNLDQANPIG